VRDRLGTGVEPDVVLVGGKVDEVAPLPVGGHAPGDPLLRVGKGGSQSASHLEELRPHSLVLLGDVLVDGEGLLAAGVRLALAGKLDVLLAVHADLHSRIFSVQLAVRNPVRSASSTIRH
jgi:hypothetical protein